MPICEPKSLKALGLIDFQINPHYTNRTLECHSGESRDQRIHAFCQLHLNTKVLGLPEGSYLRVQGSDTILDGAHDGIWFSGSESSKVYEVGQVAKN
jgi:dipeptidase E